MKLGEVFMEIVALTIFVACVLYFIRRQIRLEKVIRQHEKRLEAHFALMQTISK
jgi:uncharacterized protein (DUF486 family)